jgi:hypothetical protein
MDIEREVQIIAYEIQTGKEEFVKGTRRILALFSVVGRSEQLADDPRTDFEKGYTKGYTKGWCEGFNSGKKDKG